MAHLALQAWAQAGEWSCPDPGGRLQHRFDEVAAVNGAEPARMPHAIVTRARLKARGKELAEILGRASHRWGILSELMLVDKDEYLFGIVDLVAPGSGGLIIDLKTGRDASVPSSPAIAHQMRFYAHLFQATYGSPPQSAIVFSLQSGPVEIRVTTSEVTELLGGIRAARLIAGNIPRPDPVVCRFCPKRMICEPHWEVVSTWDRADAIEGEIVSIEQSTSGSVALRLESAWLTGIPSSTLPEGAAPGQFVRAVRIRRRDGAPADWCATSSTRLAIVPA